MNSRTNKQMNINNHFFFYSFIQAKNPTRTALYNIMEDGIGKSFKIGAYSETDVIKVLSLARTSELRI